MRMSDQVDSETTEPAAAEAFSKENATQSEVSDEGGKENSGSITTAEAKVNEVLRCRCFPLTDLLLHSLNNEV